MPCARPRVLGKAKEPAAAVGSAVEPEPEVKPSAPAHGHTLPFARRRGRAERGARAAQGSARTGQAGDGGRCRVARRRAAAGPQLRESGGSSRAVALGGHALVHHAAPGPVAPTTRTAPAQDGRRQRRSAYELTRPLS
jgi:hypothetical protein